MIIFFDGAPSYDAIDGNVKQLEENQPKIYNLSFLGRSKYLSLWLIVINNFRSMHLTALGLFIGLSVIITTGIFIVPIIIYFLELPD